MAQGVDHKMENLVCAAVISSVSELNPEKPRQNEFSQFEMQIFICEAERTKRESLSQPRGRHFSWQMSTPLSPPRR